MQKRKTKFYVVWQGWQTGVFDTWEACHIQINGFQDAKFKSFPNIELANKAFKEHYSKHFNAKNSENQLFQNETSLSSLPIKDSISVDAACDVSRGIMEYKGVLTHNKKVIFSQGPFEGGTNNIGEFLAIVHALAFCKKHHIQLPIYTDSITALAWVRKKKANTKQEETLKNASLFDMINRAENWLKENTYSNHLLKWNTRLWGEIPADYGRK